MTADVGRLVVVGTPIGNLGDLSARAIDALNDADAIACEDTRRTGLLLKHFGIAKKPLIVANEHTEVPRSVDIVDRILAGERVALVSDAGMPGISDPGQRLVRAVADAGLTIEVVPGPTAATMALVTSGLATDRFVFEGFLPRKGEERRVRLGQLRLEPRTAVIYESPKRVAATLRDLADTCGANRQAAVCRELTKLHEEVVRGTLEELTVVFADRAPRGELVLVLDGAPLPDRQTDEELLGLLEAELHGGVSTRDAVAEVVRLTGEPKRRVYALATEMKRAQE